MFATNVKILIQLSGVLPRICILNKDPGASDADGLWTTL